MNQKQNRQALPFGTTTVHNQLFYTKANRLIQCEASAKMLCTWLKDHCSHLLKVWRRGGLHMWRPSRTEWRRRRYWWWWWCPDWARYYRWYWWRFEWCCVVISRQTVKVGVYQARLRQKLIQVHVLQVEVISAIPPHVIGLLKAGGGSVICNGSKILFCKLHYCCLCYTDWQRRQTRILVGNDTFNGEDIYCIAVIMNHVDIGLV